MKRFSQGRWRAYAGGTIDIEDDKGRTLHSYCDVVGVFFNKAEADANARLIAAAPEMYELINELAGLPGEQCMIGPMIHEARRLIARIDGEEADINLETTARQKEAPPSFVNDNLSKLKSERTQRGLTSKNIAAALGVSRYMVYRYENKKGLPRKETYNLLARFFGWKLWE